MEYKVLDSLHRPYHRPLWMVKWVCYFFRQREKNKAGYILCKDRTADFYFSLIGWLHERYPEDRDGTPSIEMVEEVWKYFNDLHPENREQRLKEILTTKREKGVETRIYSSYKAASYYLNLATEKLRFTDKNGLSDSWTSRQLTKNVLKSGIAPTDRKHYFQHILQNDAHFFLSLCLLQKPAKRYELKLEDEVFKFMQRYYPSPNFDYAKQSHSNYYGVRKHWMELLKAVNEKDNLSPSLLYSIKKDSETEMIFHDVALNVKSYMADLRKRSSFVKKKNEFISSYEKLNRESEDKSGYVNLYDISKEVRMGYDRFQLFLTQFYQEERLERNIFFINIVSTIEQRKRFYIGKAPVIKIKITKSNGI